MIAALLLTIHLGYAPDVFFLGPPNYSNVAARVRPTLVLTWRLHR